jgi:hypothetical protein
MQLLTVHLVVGILAVLLGALSVGWRAGRRVTLYVLTLQIALGVWLTFAGLRAPGIHYGLALLAWAGLMAANVIGRRRGPRVALVWAGASVVLLLIAFGIGWTSAMHAA